MRGQGKHPAFVMSGNVISYGRAVVANVLNTGKARPFFLS